MFASLLTSIILSFAYLSDGLQSEDPVSQELSVAMVAAAVDKLDASAEPNIFLQPRDWISGFALFASLCSLGWSIHTSRRTRKASIHDDFWFRQVTYPLVIEPLLNFFASQIDELPQSSSSPLATQMYLDAFSGDLERHRRSSALFPILLHSSKKSLQVYDQLDVSLDAVEDAVADYCALVLEQHSQTSDTSACINKMRLELTSILSAIQKWHARL